MTVRVGTPYADRGGQVYQVRRIINHSRFDENSVNYDFSLLELAKAITFDNRRTKAIPLPNPYYDQVSAHSMCFVSGWGKNSMYGEPTFLQGVEVPIISNAECQQAIRSGKKITDAMMCAGLKNGHRDGKNNNK